MKDLKKGFYGHSKTMNESQSQHDVIT